MPANPINTDDFGGELFNLAMSARAKPLLERVVSFTEDEIKPAPPPRDLDQHRECLAQPRPLGALSIRRPRQVR
jgi:hypothetical protein